MKKIVLFVSTVLLFVFCTNCKDARLFDPLNQVDDLEFDESSLMINVTEQTKSIEVGFHRDGSVAPEGFTLAEKLTLCVDESSSAKLGVHYSIDKVGEFGQTFIVNYDKGLTTGKFPITLIPGAITEEVEIIIKPYLSTNINSTTIKLIPEIKK